MGLTLEIYGCEGYPLDWQIISQKGNEEEEILAGSKNSSQDFKGENLTILNGENAESIFVTDEEYLTPDIKEFSLIGVACENSELRKVLKKILEKSSCQLKISVPG